MFGIGMPELILILVIGLVLFGPGKLPEVGKALGRGINEFKKATSGVMSDAPMKTVETEKKVEEAEVGANTKSTEQK